MFRTLWRIMSIALLMSLLLPTVVEAQRTSRDASDGATSSALVSGTYRVEIQQAARVTDAATVGLPSSNPGGIVVAIADVSNLGLATVLDPTVITIGSFAASPLELATGTPADLEASKAASVHLKLSLDGNFAVAENSTIRVALVFLMPADGDASSLAIRVGEQVMSIDNTMLDELDVASVPVLKPTMELRIADITLVSGSSKLSVAFRDGGNEDITLAGIYTPKQTATGAPNIPGCFFDESTGAITSMSGGTVWLEQDPSGEGYLVWINNAAMGTFDLLNGRLVQEGFAGVNDSSKSPYTSWLSAATEWARSQETGLWTTCKSAGGAWISQPTPAPVPTQSPDEIRAEYQWVDPRDLDIRPGNFQDKKIAVAGTVFTIQADGDFTFLQIWANGGDIPVVVVYRGDSTGVYEGTWVTVYGTGNGTFEGTNAYGGTISQPVIIADILDH